MTTDEAFNAFPPEAGPTIRNKQGFEGEPYSKSLAELCDPSPDKLHWWYHMGYGAQSSEIFECKWCHTVNVD